jgi:hypothetical protein
MHRDGRIITTPAARINRSRSNSARRQFEKPADLIGPDVRWQGPGPKAIQNLCRVERELIGDGTPGLARRYPRGVLP